jgi:hypothetical protein
MTTLQREQLFAALMAGVPTAEEIGKEVYREFVDITTADLDVIEPLLDAMLTEAFQAGKRFADRKTEADIVKGAAEHVLIL